jgi:ABC-2 type transport system ATP-binding protein
VTQLTPFRTRLAERLSGGMKQKLALACTLVHEPEVIVLDEPTTGVDPVSRREFWKLLSHFLESGITILMSTPYLDEAERCHRIAMLHEGQVLALDEPGSLRGSLPGQWFEVVVGDPRTAVARLEAGSVAGLHTYMFGDRLHVWLDHSDAARARQQLDEAVAAAGVTPTTVRAIAPSLEDVFISKLTGTVTS